MIKARALEEVRTDPLPVFSPILDKMLKDIDLNRMVYASPFRENIRPCEVDFKPGLKAFPFVVDALRAIAEAIPAQPPRPYRPKATTSDGCRSSSPSLAAFHHLHIHGAFASLGPLTWGRRPAAEFRALLRDWQQYVEWASLFIPEDWEDAASCSIISPQLKGEGYACIGFPDIEDASTFVQVWTEHRPWGYDEVAAALFEG
jgi:hypothetical protein